MSAIAGDLDLLGLMVLSFATALGGGIVRDLLIGAVPPNAIRDWRYGAIAFAGGASVFFSYQFARQIPSPLLICSRRRGSFPVRRLGGGEGAELWHPSLCGNSPRNDYRCRRRNDSRRPTGARSNGSSRGCLRHRRDGRRCHDDRLPETQTLAVPCRVPWRCRLLRSTPCKRLAALEPSESRRSLESFTLLALCRPEYRSIFESPAPSRVASPPSRPASSSRPRNPQSPLLSEGHASASGRRL